MFKRLLTGLAAASFSLPALSAVVTLTFEGVGSGAFIQDFYNGGTDSALQSGPNYGVSFSSNAVAATETGTEDYFSGEPSAETIMVFTEDTGTFFNYAAGFTTGFSFYYSSYTVAYVEIYGDTARTEFLTRIDLDAQNSIGCSGAALCNWTPIGASFTGTARSVLFSGSNQQTGFDNITFGCDVPGGCTASNENPEPGTLALVGLALAGLGFAGRRARA